MRYTHSAIHHSKFRFIASSKVDLIALVMANVDTIQFLYMREVLKFHYASNTEGLILKEIRCGKVWIQKTKG